MNIVVVAGSNRANSGSAKVATYIKQELTAAGHTVTLFDLHTENLPLWSEAMWDETSDQAKGWQPYQSILEAADALVLVAPEWNGTTAPALMNFIMHLNRPAVGHKPALLVGVSAGIGGTYPIAELKAFANKNNRLVFIPDHVIIRGVGKVLGSEADPSDDRDQEARGRLRASLSELTLYAEHFAHIRAHLTFDYDTFTNGM